MEYLGNIKQEKDITIILTSSIAVKPGEKISCGFLGSETRLRIYPEEAKVLDMPTNIYDGVKLTIFVLD